MRRCFVQVWQFSQYGILNIIKIQIRLNRQETLELRNHGGCEIGLWNRVKSFQNRDTVPLKDFRELK